MLASLRRMFVLGIMALALLAGMLGWSLKVVAAPLIQHHSNHSIAWYCPPPPKDCA